MFDEIRNEDSMMINSIAEQTQSGKIQWTCEEYNPLGFMDEDRIDDEPAYLSQMFRFTAVIGGQDYTLELFEKINIPDGKGDIGITLTRDDLSDYMQIDTGLTYHFDLYDDCSAEQLAERFMNDPAVILSNTLVPQAVESDAVKDTSVWARFINEKDIPKKLLNHPLTKLGEKLFNEHRILDYHRIVLDTTYRNELLSDIK